MANPRFSIICPAFNHEKYVSDFINSVIGQTVTDWELIIVDDCSSDNTVKIIKTFHDKRIKLVEHKTNGGINAAINTGVENASGEYWVLIASDDMLHLNALEKIGQAFDEHPNVVAVYCNLDMVDENGKPRTDYVLPQLKNRSRASLLHDAFMDGNILYGPGMSMRAKYAKKMFPATPANCLFQDYIQNVQLLIMGDIFIIPQPVIRYRFMRDESNISAVGFYTDMRANLETDSLMDVFLDIKDIDFLKDIFAKEIKESGITVKKTGDIKYFLGRMAMLSGKTYRKVWGFHKIMDCYNADRQKMFRDYKFEFRDLVALFKSFERPVTAETKYKKYKRLFNLMLIIVVVLSVVAVYGFIK